MTEDSVNVDKQKATDTHTPNGPKATKAHDPSRTVGYKHRRDTKPPKELDGWHTLKMPTANELLQATFGERRHLLSPWLREHEASMVYASTGIGKSLFALSAAIAIAGNGEFLGWKPDKAPNGDGWRVLYVDGEMHIGDIQERLRQLSGGMKSLDKVAMGRNLVFLARQHQDPGTQFPSITEPAGQDFVFSRLKKDKFNLVVLDNFSTLGEVEDENAASSFNPIQGFLLNLKTAHVATMLVHHANKAGDAFRGTSKMGAIFESIIQLERPEAAHRDNMRYKVRAATTEPGGARFRLKWDKVRSGLEYPRGRIAFLGKGDLKQFGEDPPLIWEYTGTGDAGVLDEMAERLPQGDFQTQKEIGDAFGVSPTMARKYIDQGIKYGLWREDQISQYLALGKRLRTQGKTEAPVRPDYTWQTEALSDEEPAE